MMLAAMINQHFLFFLSMLTIVCFSVSAVMVQRLFARQTKSLVVLWLFAFITGLFAITAIVLGILLSQPYLIEIKTKPYFVLHVLLSIFAFSVIAIAALQAMILALQDFLLRKQVENILLKKLPSLEVMEHWLFNFILFGFVLLTLVLLTSYWTFSTSLSGIVLQKMTLVVIAWILFAVLLMGRKFFGWRGRRAIRGTLCGFILLLIAYLGFHLNDWVF